MDYNAAKIIVDEIENNYLVNRIRFNGNSVWPVVKYCLFFDLLKYDQKKPKGEEQSARVSEYKSTILSKIKFHFTYISKILLSYFRSIKEINDLSSKLQKNTVLFLDVSDVEYVDLINNKSYSRYISPYVEFFNSKQPCSFLHVATEPSKLVNKTPASFFLNCSNFLFYQKALLFYKKKIFGNSGVDGFYDLVQLIRRNVNSDILSEAYLTEYLETIGSYEKLWNKLIDKLQPKIIFLECYYGNENYYGIVAASKKYGIKTVDIQHGISADQMYNGFATAPSAGYSFLPDYYWCWSKYDVESISETRKNSKVLEPVIGGNLWLLKNLKEEICNPYDNGIKSEIAKMSPRATILVTLQHSIPISQILIEAIKSSPADWFWMIRFHPLDHVDPGYRKGYIDAIGKIRNVEFENSTKANLYTLFKMSQFHVTHHSTSAVEAITFEVPTILLGKKFSTIFEKFIDSKNFFVAEDHNDILTYVSNGITINKGTYDRFKIITDENTANKKMTDLLCAV